MSNDCCPSTLTVGLRQNLLGIRLSVRSSQEEFAVCLIPLSRTNRKLSVLKWPHWYWFFVIAFNSYFIRFCCINEHLSIVFCRFVRDQRLCHPPVLLLLHVWNKWFWCEDYFWIREFSRTSLREVKYSLVVNKPPLTELWSRQQRAGFRTGLGT